MLILDESPTSGLVEELIQTLRTSDIEELTHQYCGRMTPQQAIRWGASVSDRCFAAVDAATGQPVLLAGVKSYPSFSSIWMVGSTAISDYPRLEVARITKRAFPKLAAGHSLLYNEVSVANQDTIRWLRWLGFVVDYSLMFPAQSDPDFFFVPVWRNHEPSARPIV